MSTVPEPVDSPRHRCFGCGERNPQGLRMKFDVLGYGRVRGQFVPREEHQGFQGYAHGGIGAAILDEAMGWAVYAAGAWALTAHMDLKYRRPVPIGEPVTVTAEVTREGGRWMELVAEARSADGETLTEAKATFARVSKDKMREMDLAYLGRSREA